MDSKLDGTDKSSATAKWQLWRQDDNGNRFVIQTCDTREEAERLVDLYTARGHKQTYWVERLEPRPERR